MKIQDQVCTLEQSKRLKEFGIKQDAIWFWTYPVKEKMISTRKGIIHYTTCEDILRDNDGDEFDHEVAAAFTVAELGVMIGNAQYSVSYRFDNIWFWHAEINTEPFGAFKTEAEAKAAILIHLLEQELAINVEGVNARLCADK